MDKQTISLLMDDELSGDEPAGAIDQIAEQSDLVSTWGRYHLIGQVIRDNEGIQSAAGSRPADDNVVPLQQPPTKPGSSRLAPVASGFAIAASVAALTVVLVTQSNKPASDIPTAGLPEATPAIAELAPAPALPVAELQRVAETRAVSPEAAASNEIRQEHRLDGYLVNFNEQRSRLGVPSVHPYVRIVSFENE